MVVETSDCSGNTFPRIRGGDPETFARMCNVMQLFPAYAGVIPAMPRRSTMSGSFPRMCGVCEKESRAVPLWMLFCRLQILCGPAL